MNQWCLTSGDTSSVSASRRSADRERRYPACVLDTKLRNLLLTLPPMLDDNSQHPFLGNLFFALVGCILGTKVVSREGVSGPHLQAEAVALAVPQANSGCASRYWANSRSCHTPARNYFPAADPRHHHAGRHLLRGNVRRIHDFHPIEYPGRNLFGCNVPIEYHIIY